MLFKSDRDVVNYTHMSCRSFAILCFVRAGSLFETFELFSSLRVIGNLEEGSLYQVKGLRKTTRLTDSALSIVLVFSPR